MLAWICCSGLQTPIICHTDIRVYVCQSIVLERVSVHAVQDGMGGRRLASNMHSRVDAIVALV